MYINDAGINEISEQLVSEYNQIVDLFIELEQRSNKEIGYEEIKLIKKYLKDIKKAYSEISKTIDSMDGITYLERSNMLYKELQQKEVNIENIVKFLVEEIIKLEKHYDITLRATIIDAIDSIFSETNKLYQDILGTDISFFSVYKNERSLKSLIKVYSDYEQPQESHLIELAFYGFLATCEDVDDLDTYSKEVIILSISKDIKKYLQKMKKCSKNVISINLPFISEILVEYFKIFSAIEWSEE